MPFMVEDCPSIECHPMHYGMRQTKIIASWSRKGNWLKDESRGGILNYIEKVLQVKFLQFGNRFNINHTKKKIEFTKKGNEY